MSSIGVEPLNHHLWRNKRFWWTAFTVIRDGYQQLRVRESLRTEDVAVARRRRDERMRYYASLPHHEVVCLGRVATGFDPPTACPADGERGMGSSTTPSAWKLVVTHGERDASRLD
jgi:hypothetical protein